MNPVHIDDFYFVVSEVFCELYTAFPVRRLLLVEELTGPINWDMTGLPDRKSRACFEALIWLSEQNLLSYRTVEPRDIGVEGAVLSEQAFVLLTGMLTWEGGPSMSRIDALEEARTSRAYHDLGTIIKDVFRANCHWSAPYVAQELRRSATIAVGNEELPEE